jgi:hypothetical protein
MHVHRLLPEGTSRAAAECVLAGSAPCGAHKIALGSVVKDGEASVRLTQVDKRYVLLRAQDARALTLKLSGGPAPAVRFVTDVHDLGLPPSVDLRAVGTSLTGTVRRDGKVMVGELEAR